MITFITTILFANVGLAYTDKEVQSGHINGTVTDQRI